MKIIHADCSVDYTGRGNTLLGRHPRVIIIKDDHSVQIHNDTGLKPLNYMTGKITHRIDTIGGETIWRFDSTKESLAITMHTIHSETTITLPPGDPGLTRDGTEEHIQTYLADNLTLLDENYQFLQREYPCGDNSGTVDILAQHHHDHHLVLIEIKRVATPNAVYQIKRYLDAVGGTAEGVLVAADVRPGARALADKRGIRWIELNGTPYDKHRRDPTEDNPENIPEDTTEATDP